MPTEKELAMQRKQEELQQQQQAGATNVVTPPATDTPLVTEKPKYTPLYDWSSGLSMKDAYKQGKHDRDAIWMDREKWGRENDKPANFFEAMEMTPDDFDPKKTYTENVDDQKKQQRQERWEKIGNFLSHLGNFIGAVGFGAPSQTLEPAQQLTARQQAVREKTEALRRAYNDRFLENYWKQRADERKAEQLENDNRIQDRLDVQQRLLARKQDWLEKYQQGTLDLKSEKQDIDRQLAEGKISKMERDAAIAELNAQTRRISANTSAAREARLANGTETDTTVTKQTPFGKQTTTTKKSTRPAGSFSKKPQRKKIDY